MVLVHKSVIGSVFEAKIISGQESPVKGFPACIPRVKGTASLIGRMNFFIDSEDCISPGFLVR